MTTDTTNAETPAKPLAGKPRRPLPWMTIILGGSVLLHVVAWFALQPLGETTMGFSPAEEAQRTAEVQKRELERREAERLARQDRPLDAEQSEKLKREAERKQKREIAERVKELVELRQEMEEVRQATFKQLSQRTAQDMATLAGNELERALAELERMVRWIAQHPDGSTGENDLLIGEAVTLREGVAALPPDPTTALTQVEGLVGEARKIVDDLELARTRNDWDVPGDRRTRAGITGNQARKVVELIEQLLKFVPEQMNDTSTATAEPPATPPSDEQLAAATPAELYDQAVGLEEQLNQANNDIRAAELAMAENTGFAEAQDMLNATAPQRPDLAPQLSGQPQTVGELGQMREALDAAAGQAQDMATAGQAMVAQAQGLGERNAQQGGNRYARQAMMGQAVRGQTSGVVDLTTMMDGGGQGQGETRGMTGDTTGEGANMAAGRPQESIRLAEDQVLAKAMPGRMFTENSDRAGWLYLDTWYVIGPWENEGKIEFERAHPPEWGIDFDAVYTDGKFADQPGHADHELTWQFVQADHIRVEPPRVYGAATYYAFTEVYFDHDRDMLIAIASDDAAQMWVNDDVVWADYGQSPWQLGEGYRRVRFHKGFNTVLVRIENGPGKCVWSVLLCPPEAAGM